MTPSYNPGDTLGSVGRVLAGSEAFNAIFGKPYRSVKARTKGDKPRALCACCQQPYGSRLTETTQQVRTAAQGAPEPYRGNSVLVEEALYSYGEQNGQPAAMLSRVLWNGQSYSMPYAPFCTLRCALAYARAAYKVIQRVDGP